MVSDAFRDRIRDLIEGERERFYKLSNKIGVECRSLKLWMEGKFYPRYDALIKLAEYFKVSIDYLLGLTDDYDPRMPCYVKPEEVAGIFKSKVKMYLEKSQITVYEFAKRLNVGQSTAMRWIKGNSVPEISILIRISVLLDETVDGLLGRVQ